MSSLSILKELRCHRIDFMKKSCIFYYGKLRNQHGLIVASYPGKIRNILFKCFSSQATSGIILIYTDDINKGAL
jgi:hypothetical protein